jgi:cytochrome c5
MKRLLITFLLLTAAVGFVYAQDQGVKQITLPVIQTKLAPGAGLEKVSTLCNICHSLDYITMQPRGTKAQWTATVTKMRKVMGAPINDADAGVIIDYLSKHYGTEK